MRHGRTTTGGVLTAEQVDLESMPSGQGKAETVDAQLTNFHDTLK
jgi:hypothetical protein